MSPVCRALLAILGRVSCLALSTIEPGWLRRLERSALPSEVMRVQSVAESTVLTEHDPNGLRSVRHCSA